MELGVISKLLSDETVCGCLLISNFKIEKNFSPVDLVKISYIVVAHIRVSK